MNTYKNKVTGAIILTDSELGGVWELLKTKTAKKNTKKVDEDEDVSEKMDVEE